MTTTLNRIRKHAPCREGWEKLLNYLGKTEADDEPLAITTILDSNGLDDALWALRTVEGYDREIRLYAVWCARQSEHVMADERNRHALDVAERYANGEASAAELAEARVGTWGAAWDAAEYGAGRSAWDAAWYAASAAAWDAAWYAAREAPAQRLREVCAETTPAEASP